MLNLQALILINATQFTAPSSAWSPVMTCCRYSQNRSPVSIAHSIAYTAADTTASVHVSRKDFAKTVMVQLDDKLAMPVLRSVDKPDLRLLCSLAGAGEVRLASEDGFRGQFPGIDIGAMPPFGNLYAMPVYVD